MVLCRVLAALVFIGGLAGCASYRKIPNSKLKGIDSYFYGTKIVTITQFLPYKLYEGEVYARGLLSESGSALPLRTEGTWCIRYSETDYPLLPKRVEFNKDYTLYLTAKSGSSSYYNLDRIEGPLLSVEEAKAIIAKEETAKKEATEAKFWENRNPDKLDRSQYKPVNTSDFSFDMVAGKLPAGSKVRFLTEFYIKPTGTSYKFKDVALTINLNSRYNFIRNLSNDYFPPGTLTVNGYFQNQVIVYVTVQQPGQSGTCSVDIVDWLSSQDSFNFIMDRNAWTKR